MKSGLGRQKRPLPRFQFGGISDQGKAANHRMFDGKTLRREGRWRGAMYLMGYAIECRLKAKLMEKHGVWTLEELEKVLSKQLNSEIRFSGRRGHNLRWLIELTDARMDKETLRAFEQCASWSVDWRYNPNDGNDSECGKFFIAAEKMFDFIRNSI